MVTPFITNLPTGDHPTEQLAFRGDGWIYWSQGSTTNSGVVGLNNGGGQNQSGIPCQDITLSQNVFSSGNGVFTSGYSPFGVPQPGATIMAFFNSFTGQIRPGVCEGAILRASAYQSEQHTGLLLGVSESIRESLPACWSSTVWGILAAMDGADERGVQPSNNAPDEFHLGRQTPTARRTITAGLIVYGGLPTSQAAYNPIGGAAEDVCPPPFDQATCVANLKAAGDIPIGDVLVGPPQ